MRRRVTAGILALLVLATIEPGTAGDSVPLGSSVLNAGPPGSGKSTWALQLAAATSASAESFIPRPV